MTLQHINLENLHPSKTNVRKIGAKEISDLVPSIEHLGLLQPLLVRPSDEATSCEGFEIIAGQRRYHALCKVAESQDIAPVPCLVMKEGDDARALEASLTENLTRLPMDEIDQYKAFAALINQGLDCDDIANRFGVTERLVRQRMAIANLYSPILTAYRKDDIQPSTLRVLTMASKAKQKEWWTLYKSDDEYAPTGQELKSWLLGGGSIPVKNALFYVEDYAGAILTDLFGEEQYFDDAKSFWELQNSAIAVLRDRYFAKGWQDVTILDVGAWWASWEHVKTPKTKGGGIFIEIARDGEVQCHEGYITKVECKRREKVESGEVEAKPSKPELTKAMQNYLGLHRHAVVRNRLLEAQGLTLRIATAQIIAGSELWNVQADRQKANTDAIEESLATNEAQLAFGNERDAIAALLGIECDGSLVPTKNDWDKKHDLPTILTKLIALDDDAVTRIFTYAIAETLPSQSTLVEWLGVELNIEPAEQHAPDDVFFDLLKDKTAINAMIEEVTDTGTAARHVTDTAKAQKASLRSAISAKRPDWLPRYFNFPMEAYTEQGGITAIEQAAQLEGCMEEADAPIDDDLQEAA